MASADQQYACQNLVIPHVMADNISCQGYLYLVYQMSQRGSHAVPMLLGNAICIKLFTTSTQGTPLSGGRPHQVGRGLVVSWT